MSESIVIEKVKLIKNGEKLEVKFKETGEMKSSVDKVCDSPVHPDLRNAMHGLAPHLAILADYITEKKAGDKEEVDKFTVMGYSIGGKEDEEGVTITGQRKTKRGKMITLNTPFLKLDASDEEYYLIALLNEAITKVKEEAMLYLFEGKKAPDEQQAFDFPEEKVTTALIDHPEAMYTGVPEVDSVEKILDASEKRRIKRAQSAEHPSGE